jgi:hypothetical protein
MNRLLRPRILASFSPSCRLQEPEAGRPRVLAPATYRSGTPRSQPPAVARWHAHLGGLATSIHETSGITVLGQRPPLLVRSQLALPIRPRKPPALGVVIARLSIHYIGQIFLRQGRYRLDAPGVRHQAMVRNRAPKGAASSKANRIAPDGANRCRDRYGTSGLPECGYEIGSSRNL